MVPDEVHHSMAISMAIERCTPGTETIDRQPRPRATIQLIIRFRRSDLRGFCMGSHGEQERRSGRCVPHFSKSSRVSRRQPRAIEGRSPVDSFQGFPTAHRIDFDLDERVTLVSENLARQDCSERTFVLG